MSYRDAEEQRNWRRARKFFGLKHNQGLVLHHKDENLRYEDPERYKKWLPEDLEVMTAEEHNKHHHSEKEYRRRISEAMTDMKWWNNGEKSTRSKKRPSKDFVSGRLPFRKVWWNNGEIEVFQVLKPEEGNFVKGRLPKEENE